MVQEGDSRPRCCRLCGVAVLRCCAPMLRTSAFLCCLEQCLVQQELEAMASTQGQTRRTADRLVELVAQQQVPDVRVSEWLQMQLWPERVSSGRHWQARSAYHDVYARHNGER